MGGGIARRGRRVPAFGIGPLIAASLGIILLGLLRTPLRWSGAAMVLLAAVLAARVPQPDILISADGRNVGVRGQDGRLHLMHAAKGTRDAFLLREWLAADADPRAATDASLTAGVERPPTPRSPQASHAMTMAV